jgi:hypothetical protein
VRQGRLHQEMLAPDYQRNLPKPVINGDAGYESGPTGSDFDTRRYAYESVFSGAFGHAYGAPRCG